MLQSKLKKKKSYYMSTMLPLGLSVWDSFNRQIRTYFVFSLLFMRRIAAVRNICCEMNLDQ